ncbi:MAG: D-alanyl-D-alanine carboxypeptidase [Ruminococcaceae bacterium]|nr:D-alanyl-D-alanine carboxypeptidase [Oscillospiraceae bacterium]
MKKIRFLSILVIVFYILGLSCTCFADEGDKINVAAKAALLIDADSGTVLLSQNADERLYPASLTKIMTCLIALERGVLEDEITVSENAITEGLSIYGSTADLLAGEVLTLEQLLYCMMVASANEACNVIAEYISGSISDFVELMNRKAAELGCENTHFVNPHGLHDDNHYTTANDLLKITRAAMENDVFIDICSTSSKEIAPTNMYGTRYLMTTNFLLSEQKQAGYYYEYARGIKTGHTTPAGLCLVSTAEKDGITLISVVLGAEIVYNDDGTSTQMHFAETKRMFEWGFENFRSTTVISAADPVAQVPVIMSSEVDSVIVHADRDIVAVLPKTYDEEKLVTDITIFYDEGEEGTGRELIAPVEQDAVVGEMTVSYDGTELGKVNLLSLTAVERSEIMYGYDKIKGFFTQGWVKLVLVGFVALLLIISIMSFTYTVKKQNKAALGSTYKGSSRRKQ